MGRRSSYTPEIGERIARRIADGDSIRKICREDKDCPADHHTVSKWIDDIPAFASQIAHARDAQAEYFVEKGNEIIGLIKTGEDAQIARVQLDWLKWIAGKLKPKVYGDKLDLNATVDISLADRISKARQRDSKS